MRNLNSRKIKVTLLRSFAGKNANQRRIFISLGLKKIGAHRILPNTNCVLGQINKVIQFVKVEPIDATPLSSRGGAGSSHEFLDPAPPRDDEKARQARADGVY